MAEYWKSLPRKFCDICKCWFADNKASIDFHERGKRHKENAQKRIQEIQKKGIKEFKKQQQLENEMEKIERAALAAYKKDLQNMQGGDKSETSSLIQPSNKSLNTVPESNVKLKSSGKNTQQKQHIQQPKVVIKQEVVTEEQPTLQKVVTEEQPTLQKVWYEAMTEEGYKYYWNSETSESRWEAPEEGYISIEDQNELNLNSETVVEEQNTNEEEKIQVKEEELEECIKIKEEKVEEEISYSIGPQPRYDPYGQWVTVEKKEPVEYDLQLPKPSENVVEIVIPVHKDDSTFKIKEKVIGQLSDTDCTEVTFKKRKFIGSQKKNARQRTADDD